MQLFKLYRMYDSNEVLTEKECIAEIKRKNPNCPKEEIPNVLALYEDFTPSPKIDKALQCLELIPQNKTLDYEQWYYQCKYQVCVAYENFIHNPTIFNNEKWQECTEDLQSCAFYCLECILKENPNILKNLKEKA